jgi:hypothetical protein
LEDVTGPLKSGALRRSLSEELSIAVPDHFANSTPRDLFKAIGIDSCRLDEAASRELDETTRSDSGLAEWHMEGLLRTSGFLHSPDALGISLVLLAVTLGRFERWRTGNLGDWLASAASDPYIDLVPPILSEGLLRRFGNWWGASWSDLARFILSRYMIQQHRTMAYEKTVAGERCIIETDGVTAWATGDFEEIELLGYQSLLSSKN